MAGSDTGMSLAGSEAISRHDALLARIAAQVSGVDGYPPGGALLGPRLLLLGAMDAVADERLVRLGVAVELLRRATLIHRRPEDERPWPGYGDALYSATLLGDTLLSESFRLLAEDGDPKTVSILSRAMASVSEGELTAYRSGGDEALAARHRRAAAYYRGAAETGALVGRLEPLAAAEYSAWAQAAGEAHEAALAGGPQADLPACPRVGPMAEALIAVLPASDTLASGQ